jgi:subtilisin family serine protease
LVSSTKSGDGRGKVNADIAIIDTGVGPHPDLNIAGGMNCSGVGPKDDWSDQSGHGTHVAGTAASKDDGSFFVGIAPGARIWALKTLAPDGTISTAAVVCGLDWVAKHSKIIDVTNISLSDVGADDHNCGRTNNDPVHRSVCEVVRRGVTIAVAASNDAADAAAFIPAAYDEVITVAAMADFDGIPGGLERDGPPSTFCIEEATGGVREFDDTRAFFSNYGTDVDITAPGVCVFSTEAPFFGYTQASGTSMASPHVAGGAALYKSKHPRATPAQVKAALLRAGTYDYDDSDDPDGIKEPLLNVSRF